MPGDDSELAQTIYLANMFAQRGTCKCTACQLLRKSTDSMIAQVLGTPGSTVPGLDPQTVKKMMSLTGAPDASIEEITP